MNRQIKDFMSFLDQSSSRYLASLAIVQRLEKSGFTQINECDRLDIKPGGKYYLRRMDTAVIAFVMGENHPAETGFSLASSHIDSPALKIKPQSLKIEKGVCRVGVEVYGGPILHTWLDRELSISGRVIVKGKKGNETHLVDLKEALAIIPNAAIHMNREINKGFQYNAQNHLKAILSVNATEGDPLKKLVAKHLKIQEDAILELDLYLYDPAKATLTGLEQEMIVSGRLDNLAMTHAILSGILAVQKPKQSSVAVFYDHEEIGSQSPQGASSSLLSEILERICLAQSPNREDYYRALRRSYMISADMAHAYHPAYPEKYDPDYSPGMNMGPVIKRNANLRYASSSESSLRFIELCTQAKVNYQEFLVRSDMPCGSTVGPVVAANLGIHTVDIGNPMWAMHSIRETAGVQDHLDLIQVLSQFFS